MHSMPSHPQVGDAVAGHCADRSEERHDDYGVEDGDDEVQPPSRIQAVRREPGEAAAARWLRPRVLPFYLRLIL
jgi:hypothetical protein